MVLVRQEGDAASLRVHLQPKASREGIIGEFDGILRVRVTAPPLNGRANEACLRLLANAIDLPVSRLRIVSGEHARLKTIRIHQATAEFIRARIAGILQRSTR
ncbi:MAG: DUF167 domain-containing protein [Candidatus Methylomirabilaceae bacterium]